MPLNTLDLFYTTISVILQTGVYGAYVVVMILSTCVMVGRGFQARQQGLLFALTVYMFTMSTAYWALNVSSLMNTINEEIVLGKEIPHPNLNGCDARCYLNIFDSIALINYAITDSIVVWRAWALCRDRYRGLLVLSSSLLLSTWLATLSVVGIRTASTIIERLMPERQNDFIWPINISQVASLVLSLFTNISATAVISLWARTYQTWLVSLKRKTTKNQRLMTILVESGFIYIFFAIFSLISLFIRLPFSTLGTLYQPVGVQIAGIYPTLIIILVNQKKTLPVHSEDTKVGSDDEGYATSSFSGTFRHTQTWAVDNSAFDTIHSRKE